MTLRAGYTVVKRDGIIRCYRGCLRLDHEVVWECQHEHRFGHSAARHCAEDYFESIGQHEAAANDERQAAAPSQAAE